MTDKQYTYKELIKAYINTQRAYYIHDDFKNYYNELFTALKRAFNVEFPKGHFVMLFDATVRSYLRVRGPLEDFLEASATLSRLIRAGSKGQVVMNLNDEIHRLSEESKKNHLEILYILFSFMNGEIDRIVTSEELRVSGFDDSKEPKISDYYDYM